MSKKYFAKWVVVEGDIKAGDSYLKGSMMILKCLSMKKRKLNRLHYKKVKLSLCSTDLQVGDRAYFDGIPHSGITLETIISISGYIIQTGSGGWYIDQMPNPPYKVIGEISPEATWVEEGMRFDEEEIQYCMSDGFENFEGYNMNIHKDKEHWMNPKKPYKSFIKIKCPHCKTFQ